MAAGVTRPIALRGRLTGTGTDPWGGERLGLTPGQAQLRADQLETYLDHIEVVIEEWAEQHGA